MARRSCGIFDVVRHDWARWEKYCSGHGLFSGCWTTSTIMRNIVRRTTQCQVCSYLIRQLYLDNCIHGRFFRITLRACREHGVFSLRGAALPRQALTADFARARAFTLFERNQTKSEPPTNQKKRLWFQFSLLWVQTNFGIMIQNLDDPQYAQVVLRCGISTP
ncbi:hypothetical protein BC629DRAFT_1086656 [Irpex lacteus]|nr:hypothetical protein BC629DRAFT_1086656 [Irpex lacteus]